MFSFRITPDDGDPFEVTATSRDVYQWERASKSTFSALAEDMAMADLYSLAHFACRRRQLFTGTLDEFVKSHDLMPLRLKVGQVDPTQPEASAESLPDSPLQPASPRASGPRRAGARSPRRTTS